MEEKFEMMEQYIGKKKPVEIIAHIIGGFGIVLLFAGIIFTIITLTGEGIKPENNMWDIATIAYTSAVIFGIVYLFFILSGRLSRRKIYKLTLKYLTERGLLELAQQEFAPAENQKQIVVLTQHFLYFKSQGLVVPLEDIAWAYVQQINVSRAGGPGTPMNFRPWIHDIYGNEYTFVYTYDTKNYNDMCYIINYTKKLNPNIMLGHTEENKQRYNQLYKKEK